MNEPRPLLALYKLLWEQIKDVEDFISGLCFEINRLSAIPDEKEILRSHLLANKPKNITDSGYWFMLNEEGTADRKAFVQRMIKELSDGSN